MHHLGMEGRPFQEGGEMMLTGVNQCSSTASSLREHFIRQSYIFISDGDEVLRF